MIPTDKDPMGHALVDYYNGKTDIEIIVHSNIDEDDAIPVHHLFRTIGALPEIEKMAIIHSKGKVLDIGAAAGSHSLLLQELGCEVTAIDISQLAVEVMKKRSVADARCIDFFDFSGQQFDTLLLMMNGIGITGDLDRLDHFLEYSKSLLKPGGQILFDSADLIDMYTEEDGSVRVEVDKKYYGEVTYQMQYNQIVGEKFNWLYVDIDTLREHALKRGYTCELIYFEEEEKAYLAKLLLA